MADESKSESAQSSSASASSPIVRLWTRVVAVLDKLRDVPLLLLRVHLGLLFFGTGKGKVHSIDKVTGFFASLHIPAPHFNAVLVAYTELIGGSLLVLGLATRLSAGALATTMLVALATAIIPGIGPDLQQSGESGASAWLFALNGKDEVTYLLILVAIVVLGPGRIALDRLVQRRMMPDARS